VLRQGAAGADGDHPRARRRVRALRPDRVGNLADRRVPDRRPRGGPAGDVRLRPADDSLVRGRAARAVDPVRSVGEPAGRPAADRPAAVREHAVPRRARPGARARVRLCPGASPMTEWEAVVGLEIHVHLKTRTKMFCRCELEYFAEPNTRTCPVCLAHPGALPVANRKAVEWTIKLGLALGCDIADEAVFARKNYFYPDNAQ